MACRRVRRTSFTTALVVLPAMVGPAQLAGAQCLEWFEAPTTSQPVDHDLNLVYDEAHHVPAALKSAAVYWFDGDSWALIPFSAPHPLGERNGCGACYHAGRQTVMLFGGGVGELSNDFWEWNGAAWSRIQHAGAWPPVAGGSLMEYDRNRGRVILLHSAPLILGQGMWQTWEWTGASWEQGPNLGPIGDSGQTAFCFDIHRNVGFVYTKDAGSIFEEVWEFTPGATASQGTWAQVPISGSQFQAYDGVSLVYDRYRRQVIRHAGRAVGTLFGFIPASYAWDPDARNWGLPIASMPFSHQRAGAGACFDPDSDRIVMYGGLQYAPGPPAQYNYFHDTWVLHRQDPGIVVDLPATALWCPGGSHVLAVTIAGTANVQWFKDGNAIIGANSTILLVNPASTVHNGVYECRVWNGCGEIWSRPCTVTVPAPVAIQQPFFHYANVCPGGTMAFVHPQLAPGTLGTLVLQKQFGEFWETVPVPYNTVEQAFIVSNPQNADTGWYRLAASNACATVVSNPVHVQVGVTFAAQPQSIGPAACQFAELSVDAAGVGPLTYQWHKDGQPITDGGHISGAMTDTLTIAGARYDDEGSYHCVVSDTCETRQTASATLSIPAPPPWVHRTTSGPPYRSVHASDIAYDPIRGVCVIYGGYGHTGFLDDTWEWDGIEWTRRFPPANPGKRSGQELVFDPVRGVILLFGGSGAMPYNSEVWSYDGTNWTLITTSPGGPPVNEGSHGDMAFDAARGRLVLICEGPASFPVPKNVTWEFDSAAATWQQVSAGFGPSHYHSPVAFDQGLNQTVAQFYWPTMAPTEARTWVQTGGPWTDLGISTPVRYWPVMAWDAFRERTTIYGCCRNEGPGAYRTDTHAFAAGQWTRTLDDFHTSQGSAIVPLGMAFDTRRHAMVMVGGSYDDYWAGVPLQTREYRYLDRVVIDRQPVDRPLVIGQDASFTVHAAGIGTLSYQWLKGGVPLLNGPTSSGSVIGGATAPTLTITGVTPSDAGSYTCSISNACGSLLTTPAMLGTPCYPDCNGSGSLTIADFGCFQSKFVSGDPYADCNLNGSLTIADFGCFQSKFAAGCP